MSSEHQQIGHIRLSEVLGEGGMGKVWKGYDQKLRREVAVKSLRSDHLNLQTRARLLAEARVLSQLEHPNICRLYDYLESDDQDYLVMELVRGRTLRESMGELKQAEKLRIAEEISQTLSAAHSRGIVHRDLKPSNVMLTDEGEVKVLDFGLARSVESAALSEPAGAPAFNDSLADNPAIRAEDGTLTRLGSLVMRSEDGRVTGTPAFMSPEQAQGQEAGPASDMYSFGLLLQELFTGRPAYDRELGLPMLLVKAAEGDTLPIQGVDRHIKTLIEHLLELAPEDRSAASGAAAALRSVRERPKRRRRLASVVIAVAAFLGGGVKYAYDQKTGREREVAARQEAEQVTGFLSDLFTASGTMQEEVLTLRQVLDRGSERLAEELKDQPKVRWRLLDTLGMVYDQLGEHEAAEVLFREALEINRNVYGAGSVELGVALHNLGTNIHRQGRYEDAKALYTQAAEIFETHPGSVDSNRFAELLDNLANIYDELGDTTRPGPLYQQALTLLEENPEADPDILSTVLLDAGIFYRNIDNYELAEDMLLRGLEIRESLNIPAGVAEVLNSLIRLYSQLGEPERSEPLFRRAIEVGDPAMGADHRLMSTVRRNFTTLLEQSGELERAETLILEVLEAQHRGNARHDFVALNEHVLALVYLKQGRFEEAEPLFRLAITDFTKIRGEDHPKIGQMLLGLAVTRRAMGYAEEAEDLLRRAETIRSDRLGESDRYLIDIRLELARIAVDRGDFERAQELQGSAHAGVLKRLDVGGENASNQTRLARTLFEIGELANARGKLDEATGSWQEALQTLESIGPTRLAEARRTQALLLLRLGRLEEARALAVGLLEQGRHDPELARAAVAAGEGF